MAMSNQKELWKLISTFMASVNEKLDSLSQTIKTIQQQHQRIEARIDFLEEKIEKFQKIDEGKGINRSQFQEVIKKVVHKMETNNQALKEELVELEQKIDNFIKKQPRETKVPLENLEKPSKVSISHSSISSRSKPVATHTSISNPAPSSPSSSSNSLPPSPVRRPSPSRALGTLSSLKSSKPEKIKDLEEIEKITDEDKKLQAALKMFKDM
ncbi:MAG: hypothetical protein ACFFC7_25950 [Candidatus Hermodarchaeota archaeon]